MMRLAMVLTALGLAAPALAANGSTAQAAVLDDAQLDQVAAGCDSTGTPTGVSTLPALNTNVNFSPIIVNQTAVAITQQNANQNVTGKGKAFGLLKQNATTVAMNYLNINYHPKF
jgi:TRAP-type uncharacterized transport system substrate-binding protein